MIRIRVPGGVATSDQWLETDRMATEFANGTIKLTTRQAFQFHGIIKSNLKRTIKEINDAAMDTIAACRRRESQRDVQPEPASFVGACRRAAGGEGYLGAPHSGHACLPRDLARR